MIYVGGGLFNNGEKLARLEEGKQLKEKDLTYYNPIENDEINDKSKIPTAEDIFDGDTEKVLESDYILADLSTNDIGLAMELGIAIGINIAKLRGVDKYPFKEIYAHNSDIRIGTANQYQGVQIPVGWNQYVVGGVQKFGKIFNNAKEAIDAIEKGEEE